MQILSATMAATLVAGALLAAPARAADPVGNYLIQGNNPGGGSNYGGTVSVTKTGDTYQVIWVVGSTRYVGTGIGNSNFMAVSYRSGSDTGLALYGADGSNWKGIWTYSGGRQIGAESWSRQ